MPTIPAFRVHDYEIPERSWTENEAFEQFIFKRGEPKSLGFLAQQHGIELPRLRFDVAEFYDLSEVNPAQPVIAGDQIVFSESGLYIARYDNTHILFMVPPESSEGKVSLAFDLITHFVMGIPHENELSWVNPRQTLYNLFYAPQPFWFNCGPSSMLMRDLLESLGVYSRLVWCVNAAETESHRRYHMCLEAFLPERMAWQLIDVHYGLLYVPGFSALAGSVTDWPTQKRFVRQSIDKSFYTHDEFMSYDHSKKLIMLRAMNKMYLCLINPNVSEKDLLRAYCDRGVQIKRLVYKDFCFAASYEGTLFLPVPYGGQAL